MARLHGLNQMLQSALAAGERVFDILDHDAERDESRTTELSQPVRGEVIYEDVFLRTNPTAPCSRTFPAC